MYNTVQLPMSVVCHKNPNTLILYKKDHFSTTFLIKAYLLYAITNRFKFVVAPNVLWTVCVGKRNKKKGNDGALRQASCFVNGIYDKKKPFVIFRLRARK